jgi:hypothetical protein
VTPQALDALEVDDAAGCDVEDHDGLLSVPNILVSNYIEEETLPSNISM